MANVPVDERTHQYQAEVHGEQTRGLVQKERGAAAQRNHADQAIKFRMSLPFRTGDSSSLSVHWAVIGGFFNWAVGMGYIEKTPILSGRQNKQFAIPFKKKEVVPPGREKAKMSYHTVSSAICFGLTSFLYRG